MANDKIFANGFLFKRSDKAPSFVVGNISVKIDEAIPFLEQYAKKIKILFIGYRVFVEKL